MLVNVDFKTVGHEGPLSDVELPLLVKKGLFNVFLQYPSAGRDRLREEKLLNVFQVFVDLNSSSLVPVLWLHEPNVLRAVFHGRTLFSCVTLGYLLETIDEWIDTALCQAKRDQIGSWRRVERLIVARPGLSIVPVVAIERAN